jgi:serine/threonine protein kinase
MKIDETKTCSVCGTPLSAASEFCPACMLRIGLEGGTESGGSSSEQTSSEPTQPELEVQRFENYEVVKGEDGTPVELGRGAMGVTYKAFDVDLRCLVTLKVISARYLNDESARLRFLREARAAASLRHPNVASVFHLGRSGENYFYAMEFVEGETLESLIQRSGRLEVKLALEIAAQVAAGLAAVHEQKLVHRDIKPTNIMVSLKDGNRVSAKIIDLGLSKTVAESPSQPAISMPGAFAGTPEFASPEQFAGVGVDIRSDLYSLGVTLWEMLTGKVPFRGTPAEVMYEHQHAPLPLEHLIDVPQPIVVLLQVLLEKDPKWRFQNPTELVNALPKVNDAIKARRSVTDQNLRTITDERLGTRSKATSVLPRLITALWAALALLAAGGLITSISTFFTASHRIPDASIPALSATNIPEKSIAVLPFESLSDNKSDTYFADGVQDEILNNLAKIAQLKVISRTSVMQYRGNEKRDLRQIAAALGVANVLEGTVRRDGNSVRVSTELINAHSDNTVWADSYDRDLT